MRTRILNAIKNSVEKKSVKGDKPADSKRRAESAYFFGRARGSRTEIENDSRRQKIIAHADLLLAGHALFNIAWILNWFATTGGAPMPLSMLASLMVNLTFTFAYMLILGMITLDVAGMISRRRKTRGRA